MSDCVEDYNASIGFVVDEYRALKRLSPRHDLLKMVKLARIGFRTSTKFSKRYPVDHQARKGGTTAALSQFGPYYRDMETEVTNRLKVIIDEERKNYGSPEELSCLPSDERSRINTELEKIFEERGLIGLIRTHVTHNKIDLIGV